MGQLGIARTCRISYYNVMLLVSYIMLTRKCDSITVPSVVVMVATWQ